MAYLRLRCERDSVPKLPFNLLLVGKTGVGKSSIGNRILNLPKNPFQTSIRSNSVTLNLQFEFSRYQGQDTKVVDMPGLSNSSKNKAEDIKSFKQEISKAVAETPDGYDAILVVVQLGRLTQEDEEIIDTLKCMLGKNFLKEHGILVVSRGDDFKREIRGQKTFEEYCSQDNGSLNDMWKECNRRAVLFDNVTENKEERDDQRKDLFDLVDAMKGKSRYTPDVFEAAKAKRDELIAKKEELVLTDEIKSRLRLMMHDLNSVELETPDESITHLEAKITQVEKIKKEAQEVIAKSEEESRKVNKQKKVLNIARSIEKAATTILELANLMIQMVDDTEGSEVSVEHHEQKAKLQKRRHAAERELENMYEKLIQEDIKTKDIIVTVVCAVVGITFLAATGGGGGVAVGLIAGSNGRELLPFFFKGVISVPGIFSFGANIYKIIKDIKKKYLKAMVEEQFSFCNNSKKEGRLYGLELGGFEKYNVNPLDVSCDPQTH